MSGAHAKWIPPAALALALAVTGANPAAAQSGEQDQYKRLGEDARRMAEEAKKMALEAQRNSGVFALTAGGSYLGVGLAEVTAERAKELSLKEEYGVEITLVDNDSPAAKAGLKAKDVVLEYQGQRVEGIEQFQRLVRETPPGRTAKVLVSRGGATQTLMATLAARKTKVFTAGKMRIGPTTEAWEFNMPDIPSVYMSWRSPRLGVEAETLSTQLASFFGVKDGVLVRSVSKGSAAEKAGIKAGDVITKVDSKAVSSPQEITNAIRSLENKKGFPVTLVRERKETTVSVTMDEPEREPRDKPLKSSPVRFRELDLDLEFN